MIELTPDESRVLGVLIEKATTTPDQYPLSLNAVVNGANQKNNRDPVLAIEEGDAFEALETLRELKLRGDPVAVDGKRMIPAALLAYLNRLGGEHGVGRVDLVENRYVGIKSRGVYETPGGTILHVAHRGLESLTMDREVLHLRDSLIPRYAELIYYGYWYSPEREMLQKAFDEAQQDVSGIARVKLYKGSCTVVGRRSDRSLYRLDLATFEEDEAYRQKDAEGFIRLNALRLAIRAQCRESKK